MKSIALTLAVLFASMNLVHAADKTNEEIIAVEENTEATTPADATTPSDATTPAQETK